MHSTEGDATPRPKQKPARDILFNLAGDLSEQNDLATENSDKLYETRNAEVDGDCRQMGLPPKGVNPAATKTKARGAK